MQAEFAGPLTAAAARLGPFGQHVLWHAELPSTNDAAASLAERGVAEGCVVIAESQTAGRGRHGRTWSSPAGAGLYVSVVLRPGESMVSLVTLTAGVGLAEGIQTATGLRPVLKWPNDLFVDGRKLGGILAEAGSSGNRVGHVVLGFGINVRPGSYPPDVAARATSLEGELGRPVDRGVVLAECLAGLANRYDGLRQHGSDAVLAAWRSMAAPMLQRKVEWDRAGTVASGVAEDVDDSGALVVRTASGRERIVAGDVRWI